jgi:hypothetical protein
MIENNEYLYNTRTIAILMVLGFLLGVFIGYTTASIRVEEYSFKESPMTLPDSNRLQDKSIQKIN